MKTAIVTGGSSGIGLGVAQMLVTKGYKVYITSRGTNRNPDIKGIIDCKVDQSKREDLYAFIRMIKTEESSIDCIVCNAGATIRKSFELFSDEDWDFMMETGLTSHMILIRELKTMISPNSNILFTGSQMGIQPHATVLCYGVMKAALHALSRNLVKEFEGTGTRVNTIVPGFVATPWQSEKPQEIKENIYAKTAIHRFATISEIVDAFRFCLDNSFINGSLIEVNGGYCYK